jgi:hypothetical protein
MKKIKFDKEKFPFDKMIGNLYDDDLDKLFDGLDHSNKKLGEDTDSVFHKIFYDHLRSGFPEFIELYKKFIKEVICPLFPEEEYIIYQKTPSFRVTQPGGKAVYVPHSDGDALHKHPSGEINIFLPLTKSFGNNSMYLESIPGLGDYEPIEMEFGEILLFYGNKQRHFNKLNDTKVTRCSFDFRVVPPVNYESNYSLESATMKNKFVIGGYYNTMHK